MRQYVMQSLSVSLCDLSAMETSPSAVADRERERAWAVTTHKCRRLSLSLRLDSCQRGASCDCYLQHKRQLTAASTSKKMWTRLRDRPTYDKSWTTQLKGPPDLASLQSRRACDVSGRWPGCLACYPAARGRNFNFRRDRRRKLFRRRRRLTY